MDFIGDATAIILNSFQDYRATLRHRTYRPLFEATSIPIQLYDSELPRGRTVRHPIGFTAVDIFQVRSEDSGDRRARAFLNASYVFSFHRLVRPGSRILDIARMIEKVT